MTRRTLMLIRALWVAGTLLLAATWNENAWVLLVALPALGPILREVAPAPDTDERQRLLDLAAGAFLAVGGPVGILTVIALPPLVSGLLFLLSAGEPRNA